MSVCRLGKIAAGYITFTNGPRGKCCEYVMSILMDQICILKEEIGGILLFSSMRGH